MRRGAGEEERKLGKRRREDERRQEGTGYAVSLKTLRGSAGRGRDEQCGVAGKEVSKPVEIG